MEDSIPSLVRACRELFTALFDLKFPELGLLGEGHNSTQAVQECKQRFVGWSRETGAHQEHRKSSLEERLRGSSDLRDSVVGLLESLHDSLNQGEQLPEQESHRQGVFGPEHQSHPDMVPNDSICCLLSLIRASFNDREALHLNFVYLCQKMLRDFLATHKGHHWNFP